MQYIKASTVVTLHSLNHNKVVNGNMHIGKKTKNESSCKKRVYLVKKKVLTKSIGSSMCNCWQP